MATLLIGPGQRPQGGEQTAAPPGEQGDRFVDVAVGGSYADLEAGSRPFVGVAVAQVREHEQGLVPGGQLPPGAESFPIRL